MRNLKGKEGKKVNPTIRYTLPSPIISSMARKGLNFFTKTISKGEKDRNQQILAEKAKRVSLSFF